MNWNSTCIRKYRNKGGSLEFRQKSEMKFTLTIISTEIKAKTAESQNTKENHMQIPLQREQCASEQTNEHFVQLLSKIHWLENL